MGAVVRGYLFAIVDELVFENTDRITLYSHDDELRYFTPLVRISRNPDYEKHGRPTYPEDQGFIGKTWREGSCFVEELPDLLTEKRKYLTAMNKENSICPDWRRCIKIRRFISSATRN